MLIDSSASRELTRRALSKASMVAKAFADVRYNVTMSSVGRVLADEVVRTIEKEGASHVSSNGNSCYKRTRNLTNIGIFETKACYKGRGQTQVTVWF